ncbi:uncharacterized protein ARMOST_12162 [Armillaria ostoyae]|uniref:Heterokaryon incompatibility domain-containing protein n=1 Tax=Armillaria ostoyae TaxID=47428 RepID=A0A284RJ71_ARMOS|nr:uncharacterized protein ARMOST_12162 [Armillaria ostoyae]
MDKKAWDERYYYILLDLNREERQTDIDYYEGLPEVTLSAFTETGRTESSISVPDQRSYHGAKPVISSSLANTPCANLGVAGLLEKLSITLRKPYTLEIHSLSSVLGACITQEYDFGTAYGYLHPVLCECENLTDVEDELRARKEWDREMRESVLVNNRILNNIVLPRRIWDLYSNRVVPWWTAKRWPWGISHAWMDEKDRSDVETPINRGEWPYVWLDVLCLRQKGGLREDLRREEWQLDVPTIGSAYDSKLPVVYYFSGLGRPLHVEASDFESDRNWFRRVWTLQEIAERRFFGGVTGNKAMKKEIYARFDKEPLLLEKIAERQEWIVGVFNALSLLQHRESTSEVDKIAAMAYVVGGVEEIPAYYEMRMDIIGGYVGHAGQG